MSESSSTTRQAAKARTVAATTPLVMHAVTEFALDHDLEVWSINSPRPDERAVTISVPFTALVAWVAALEARGTVDGDPVVDQHVESPAWESVVYTGSFPTAIGDLQVSVRASHQRSRALTVVPA